MSNWLEEPTFNVKRARWVLGIFAFALAGLFLYSQFINAISIQTGSYLILGDGIVTTLIAFGLKKEKEEQEEEQEILREIEEKQSMQKEIQTLKAELEKNKK